MKNNRLSYTSSRRDSWVEINLGNLEHNIKELKSKINSDKKILAVIKADAYGHGACMIAPTLIASGVNMFGVASLDEAVQLREAGFTLPVLVLGAVPVWAFDLAIENDITLSIFSEEHLNAAKQSFEKTKLKLKAHIKIDTGMNRIGVKIKDSVNFIKKVQKCEYIDLQGVFTHFAFAENIQITAQQLFYFNNVIDKIDRKKLIVHCANTATAISFPKETDNTDMVRLGIGIYGLMPDLHPSVKNIPCLKPVMGLKGRIVNIHEAEPNSGVSYSHTYITNKKTKIATISLGYADGIPRALSNKLKAKLKNKTINQIGNITMDQMMFDITGIEAKEGDIITVLDDKDLSVNDWAEKLNTINYELTCRLKVRLARVYTR